MGQYKLCLGCMEDNKGLRTCPRCGYTEGAMHLPSYLAPGTLLNDRYLVGKLLNYNGEGATYIAYDTVIGCKINIREYMPDALCSRVKGTSMISVHHNYLAQYKSLMSEFTETNKVLGRMRTLSHICPSLDIFTENNTTYVVFEQIEGITLMEYLKENAGELTWEQVKKLFPPLFTTLSLIHNTGLVHRGISLNTIYYTDKGELKLTGFATAALRTANSELASELFQGYAAPEQYTSNGWQGTWTDVYGICAVLYRILTGCMPTEALSRTTNDNLSEPNQINPNVPRNVSKVIMNGMRVMGESRIQTITELVTKLFEQPAGYFEKPMEKTASVPIITAKELKPKANTGEVVLPEKAAVTAGSAAEAAPPTTVFERIKVPLMVGVLLLAVLMVLAIIAVAFFSDSDKKPNTNSGSDSSSISSDTLTVTTSVTTSASETETSSPDTVMCKMSNIVGRLYDEIKLSSAFTDYLKFDVEEVYDDTGLYPKGVITWQEVKENEFYEKGSTVKIKVSKGSSKVAVPDFKNYGKSGYSKLLDSLKIPYEMIPKENTGKTNGSIISTSIEPGDVFDLSDTKLKLKVYYAKGEEAVTTTVSGGAVTGSQGSTGTSNAGPETTMPTP